MSREIKRTVRSNNARAQKAWAFSFVENMQQPIQIRFGNALRARRIKIGLTQDELAQRAGLNRSFISEIENGHENISLARAERLAHALDCKLTDLLNKA